MELQKHHKWMIGGISSIIIIYMVISAILLNGIIIKQTINHNEVKDQISELQADTQSKFNELTNSLLATQSDLKQTKSSISNLGAEIGSIGQEFELLKASAGEDFSGIIEESVKSVVTIRTDVSQGTGFIISDDGYLVTNAHVLVGASEVESVNYEQEKISTDFIGYNGELDIALLKIKGNNNYLELEDSDNIQVGEKVIAIGNPLGLQFSVSEGIVSGVHRTSEGLEGKYIQTDAALNPGNSGGPLINKKGKVIGINNFKFGEGESLGFALESNYVKEAINKIAQENLNQSVLS